MDRNQIITSARTQKLVQAGLEWVKKRVSFLCTFINHRNISFSVRNKCLIISANKRTSSRVHRWLNIMKMSWTNIFVEGRQKGFIGWCECLKAHTAWARNFYPFHLQLVGKQIIAFGSQFSVYRFLRNLSLHSIQLWIKTLSTLNLNRFFRLE